jgi:hypothetical protein
MRTSKYVALILAMLALIIVPLPVSAAGSLIRYANYTTGDGGYSRVFSENWSAETFNWSSSFTATYARIKIMRVGSPGTLTASLQATNATGYPDGNDLCSVAIDIDAITTSTTGDWYTVDFDDVLLAANTEYALVVRTTGADTSNCVHWRLDNAGEYTEGGAYDSSDGGAIWSDLGNDDYMFEIYGLSVLDIYSGAVFQDYYATGDWLVTCAYFNTYAPYYPITDPQSHFVVQLLSGSTVIAQRTMPQWGYKPVGIYLSAASVSSLTWGSAYTLRIYGIDSPYPSVSYTLTAADWKGSDLAMLDSWCIATAHGMEDYYGTTFIVLTTEKGEVLNEEGGVIFDTGIPGLSTQRGEYLFQVSSSGIPYEEPTWTASYSSGFDEWYTQLGPDMASLVNSTADLIDTDGLSLLRVLLLIAYAGVAIVMVANGMGFGAFAVLSPFLMFAYMAKILPWAALGVGIAILVMMAVRQLWWKST